jgi:hypothetical protein
MLNLIDKDAPYFATYVSNDIIKSLYFKISLYLKTRYALKKTRPNNFRKCGYDIIRYRNHPQWRTPQVLTGLNLPPHIMSGCKLLPDRDYVLPLLPKGGIVAELGVAYGDFSRKILNFIKPEYFYAIDIFPDGPGI